MIDIRNNLKLLIESEIDDIRIPALVLKTIKFFLEEQISTEDRIKIIRMLDAMYRKGDNAN
ncbi:TPA: hypothetical protein I1462_000387 [Staphylococcus pseudintermedius]|uniref:hypothetical protein n=1 Tax=Staphylococcus pseudintermedius TaxID=283734 RepID=UPI0001F6C156|nr:hypothetical protein [Staphylococcus pseudintermedius]ADV05823.1 hypothetical protein SPSINT_1295 [Staphylococcus pseudintermedius HKU10-03]ANQ88227.1 hypothetical protein A9I65_06150 [Staphylococcus pseudintermedius]AYG56522.1 hypothetical protein D8L98_08935 [Staphylococcus pseudintermedius]EGQ0358826.1 hypothetical protein [Staphylococcus pseudintermedius]EGQ0365747.1 hypothetical protein [Staphylococcus pseudintermedius]